MKSVHPPNGRVTLAKLFFLDAKAGWAVGSQDRLPAIWSSDDGGETWSANAWVASRFREVDPEGGVLLDVQFVDNRNGWAVGNFHGAPLSIATTDGGLNWSIQYQGRELCGQMSSIRFVDGSHGMAACSNGIFETSDGGAEWSLQHFDPVGLLNDLFVTNADDAWAAGAWGQLFKRDKRRGWRAIDIPAARGKFLAWIIFSNPQGGWAAGPSGDVYVSRNGGGSWRRDKAPEAFLHGGDLIYGTSSKVFRIVAPNRLFVRPVDD